jgi:hypothetical protein
MEKIIDEKIVDFVQSETKTKTFRHDYSVSNELRHVMVNEVFRDFMNYAEAVYISQLLIFTISILRQAEK